MVWFLHQLSWLASYFEAQKYKKKKKEKSEYYISVNDDNFLN